MNRTRWSRAPAAVLLALAFLAASGAGALAAEEAHGGERPPLIGVEWQTVLATLAVFLVLLFVLTKTAWKPILAGLQKREETIRRALDEAAEASARAKTLVVEYEQRIAKAAEEAQAIVENGRKDGEELRVRIERDAQKTAEETMTRARREIELASRKAYEDVLRDVAGIATEAASRIVRQHLTPEGHARLVDDVVRDFAATRSGRGTGTAS